MDHFLEEVVVKKNKTFNEVLYILSWIVLVLMALMAFMGLQWLLMQFNVVLLIEVLLSLGIAVFLFLRHDRLRMEYEYTFTNGTMDFAQVFNNQKRKNLGSLNVRTIEAFGPVDSDAFRRYVSMPGMKTSNWFLNRDAKLYYFFFQKESNKKMIICEPSDEMVEYIKQYLAHGVYQG